jgi:hypothetical protein
MTDWKFPAGRACNLIEAKALLVGLRNSSKGMNERKADPRLVWLASVLAAATLVIFLVHQA